MMSRIGWLFHDRRIAGVVSVIAAIFFLAFSGKFTPPRDALNFIEASEIRQHLDFLASDSLKGRNTPSPELNLAANYIADRFREYGLSPVNGSYYQIFHVSRVRLGKENHFILIKDGKSTEYRIKRDYMPMDVTGSKAVEGDLVFVGYGITAPEYQYDDYANVDVSGKIVLILRHEPGEKDPQSPFEGRKLSPYGQVKMKVQNAIDHGAVGALIVTDPLNHRSIRPRGFPWPSLFPNLPDEAIPLTLSITEKQKIPVVGISKKVVRALFGSVDSLRRLQERIDADLKPQSRLLAGIRVQLQTSTVREDEATQNVVGWIEGRDRNLKHEVVVFGAHYDHVGVVKNAAAGTDSIFNGADDNASGTSLLLALASGFGRSPARPRRSVLFIAFAGEEKGLFGSRAYVEKPLFPLENTVAMLNFDMVGRNAPDTVMVGGITHSPDLIRINEQENRFVGLKLAYSLEKFYARSDQYSFGRHKIPYLFYSTGLHKDYHKVTDHAYKINEYKIAMIAKLAFRVGWRVANSSERLRFVEKKK